MTPRRSARPSTLALSRGVPGSQFAFDLDGRQMRYLRVTPKRAVLIKELEFLKGPDRTAPVIMAVTVEAPEQ